MWRDGWQCEAEVAERGPSAARLRAWRCEVGGGAGGADGGGSGGGEGSGEMGGGDGGEGSRGGGGGGEINGGARPRRRGGLARATEGSGEDGGDDVADEGGGAGGCSGEGAAATDDVSAQTCGSARAHVLSRQALMVRARDWIAGAEGIRVCGRQAHPGLPTS